MYIRGMKIADYGQVYRLWMACSGMGLNYPDDSEAGIERFLDRNPTTCFVAEEDRQIVGVILAGNDGRRGYIYHTAVHPDYRRRGIAGRLVAEAESAIKVLGISKIALVVFSNNKAGNDFWEEEGFSVREDLVYRNKAIAEMIRTDT